MPDNTLTRLASVEALPGYRLAFKLKGDRTKYLVDLTGILSSTAALRPLLDDVGRFRTAAVVDWGGGVGWGPEDSPDRLDLSVQTLVTLATYQEDMSGQDFKAWRERLELSRSEVATLLGIGLRTVDDYQAAESVPSVVAIACRALEADRHLFAAFYRPSAPAGRPANTVKKPKVKTGPPSGKVTRDPGRVRAIGAGVGRSTGRRFGGG